MEFLELAQMMGGQGSGGGDMPGNAFANFANSSLGKDPSLGQDPSFGGQKKKPGEQGGGSYMLPDGNDPNMNMPQIGRRS
jgi:hypothetical protein